MKKFACLILLSLSTIAGYSQAIKVSSFSEIEKRVLASNDSIYVINFWATWCAPCIKELPYFDQLQREYASDKLKVLLISLDFKSKIESSVKPFLNKRSLLPEVYLLDEKDMNAFINHVSEQWSGAIPATLIINRKNGTTKFYERDFIYEELKTEYLKITTAIGE